MPELASVNTAPPAGNCSTAEELACYIDGTLSAEEAARVTEHLASCESCFEVYSGVLRFQLESAAEGGDVIPFPTSRWRKVTEPRWAVSSLAALLLIGLGGGYFYFLAPPAPLVTAGLTAPFQGETGLAESFWRGEVTRGPGDVEPGNELPPDTAAFRTGVQIVNLQVSLRNDDGLTTTGVVIPAILGTLKDQIGTGGLQKSYEGITSAIENGKKTGQPTPRDLLPQASRLATESRSYLDPLYFDLGQWVEAGRIAAFSHNPAFFQQSDSSQTFLRRALWRDRLGRKDSKLPQGSRKELEAIQQILDKGDLQPADYVKLKNHFDEILKANYPE